MNFVYVNYTVRDNVFDYAWLSFKTYVEDNYKGSAKWNWHYPINDSHADSIDDLVNDIIKKNPTIVGFSVYIWNVGLSREVAKRVKAILPDVYILFGGPYCEYKEDPEYFKNLPFIDFTCETDGYGEPFINELLYQIETDKDWSKVPFMILPDEQLHYKNVGPSFAKRSFVWPKKIFERNEDYLKKVFAEKTPYSPVMTIYETHRGCPYACSFCEWSGGINSKVSFRPTEDIIEDLTFLAKNGYLYTLHLVEANLGQLDRDVDVIRLVCDLKRKYGLPTDVTPAGLSKSKKNNVYLIDRLLSEVGLNPEYKISIQDLDPLVLKNINRVDEPWEKQYAVYSQMREEFGSKIRADLIRGLPGSTLDKYYESAGILSKAEAFWERYTWHLLPTSPASDPAYIQKFKIDAIDAPMSPTQGAAYRAKFIGDHGFASVHGLVSDPAYAKLPKIVVATYSYSREEYVEMTVVDSIILTMETEGYLSRITKYLDSIGISHAIFYRRFYNRIQRYLNPIQLSILKGIILQAQEKVHGKSTIDFEYYHIEGLPWDVYAKIPALLNIMININRASFYEVILNFIIGEFKIDNEKLRDVIEWSMYNVKWIDYDPTAPVSFVTKYDWTIDNSEKGLYNNTPCDQSYGQEEWPIDWHTISMKDRINKYFVMLCSLHGSKKTFTSLKVTSC